jgi:predicted metal-dependent HD superfamily phosphohydrolase
MKTTIDMAREAGIIDFRDAYSEQHVQAVLQDLKAFEALVRADEREACAKVCDKRYMGDNNREDMEAKRCAAAIRARGNT